MCAAATAERWIVVNADDYGLTPGISAGILECVAAGVVTSVSVMVNTPGFADGMRRLRALDRPPGVGLHFNLTAGAPVSGAREVKTLVNAGGRFRGLRELAARALLGAVDPTDVERERRAQLALLRDSWPAVDHLDSHRHVHALPGIRAAILAAAATAGIRWVRCPAERVGMHRGALTRLAVGALWHVASRGPTLPRVARVAGIGLRGDAGFLGHLLAALDAAAPGVTEVIVHPGRPEPALAAWDSYREPRRIELEALLSTRLRERLARRDLVLTDFRAA